MAARPAFNSSGARADRTAPAEIAGGSGVQLHLWTWWTRLRTQVREERGASLVEYALLLALIAVVCIVAISLLGTSTSHKFSQVGSALQ